MFTFPVRTVLRQHFSTSDLWSVSWNTPLVKKSAKSKGRTLQKLLVRQLCIMNQSDFLFCVFSTKSFLCMFSLFIHFFTFLLRFFKIIRRNQLFSFSILHSFASLHHSLCVLTWLCAFTTFQYRERCCFPIRKSTNLSKFRISTWRNRLGNRRKTLAAPIWCASTKPK